MGMRIPRVNTMGETRWHGSVRGGWGGGVVYCKIRQGGDNGTDGSRSPEGLGRGAMLFYGAEHRKGRGERQRDEGSCPVLGDSHAVTFIIYLAVRARKRCFGDAALALVPHGLQKLEESAGCCVSWWSDVKATIRALTLSSSYRPGSVPSYVKGIVLNRPAPEKIRSRRNPDRLSLSRGPTRCA
jgi:hypothetical protein